MRLFGRKKQKQKATAETTFDNLESNNHNDNDVNNRSFTISPIIITPKVGSGMRNGSHANPIRQHPSALYNYAMQEYSQTIDPLHSNDDGRSPIVTVGSNLSGSAAGGVGVVQLSPEGQVSYGRLKGESGVRRRTPTNVNANANANMNVNANVAGAYFPPVLLSPSQQSKKHDNDLQLQHDAPYETQHENTNNTNNNNNNNTMNNNRNPGPTSNLRIKPITEDPLPPPPSYSSDIFPSQTSSSQNLSKSVLLSAPPPPPPPPPMLRYSTDDNDQHPDTTSSKNHAHSTHDASSASASAPYLDSSNDTYEYVYHSQSTHTPPSQMGHIPPYLHHPYHPNHEPNMPDATYEEIYGDAYISSPIRYIYPSGYQSMRPRSGPWKISVLICALFTWLTVFIVGHCADRVDLSGYNMRDDEIDDDAILIETRWCGSRLLYGLWVLSALITGLATAYCSIIGYLKARDFAVANGRSQPPGMLGKSDYYVKIADVKQSRHDHGSGGSRNGAKSYQEGGGAVADRGFRATSIYQADGTPQFWGGHIYKPTQAAVAVTSR